MKAARRGTIVLNYHRVADRACDPEEGDYVVPPSAFVAHMQCLAERGIPVVGADALGEETCPSASVILTFDDGCDTDATTVLPILQRFAAPATFFVNPARLEAPGFLTWTQLGTLVDAGMTVGSHGLDHTLLDGISDSELRRQLRESKTMLEDRLRRTVDLLSLPGGTGGRRAVVLARELGYRLVFGSQPGVAGVRLPPLVPRFAVRRGMSVETLRTLAEQDVAFRLRQAVRYRVMHYARAAIGTGAYARLRRAWVTRRTTGGA